MKLRLAEYKEGVEVAVEQEYNPADLDLEFVDLKYVGPLKLEGTVDKGEDTLSFRGHLTGNIEHICGRCLQPIKDTMDKVDDALGKLGEKADGLSTVSSKVANFLSTLSGLSGPNQKLF